jgi:hypothetical protein
MLTPDMVGSVPEKDRYVMCHGRVAVRTVAVPPVQLPAEFWPRTEALETKPIRALGTFAMVREWKLPWSVTGHVRLLPASDVNTRFDQRASKSCALRLILLADALPTAIESTKAAVSAESKSLLRLRIKEFLSA